MIDGGYWLEPPSPEAELALVACGPVLPEVIEAHDQLSEDLPGTGLLVVTSIDRLHRGWVESRRHTPRSERSHVEQLLGQLPGTAGLVSVLDAHPSSLSWLGSVSRHRVLPLGVDQFGQSGDIPDLYRTYQLDSASIVDAAARLCLDANQ